MCSELNQGVSRMGKASVKHTLASCHRCTVLPSGCCTVRPTTWINGALKIWLLYKRKKKKSICIWRHQEWVWSSSSSSSPPSYITKILVTISSLLTSSCHMTQSVCLMHPWCDATLAQMLFWVEAMSCPLCYIEFDSHVLISSLVSSHFICNGNPAACITTSLPEVAHFTPVLNGRSLLRSFPLAIPVMIWILPSVLVQKTIKTHL